MTVSKSKERDAACLQQLFMWQWAVSPTRDVTINADNAWNAMIEKLYMAVRLIWLVLPCFTQEIPELNIKGF